MHGAVCVAVRWTELNDMWRNADLPFDHLPPFLQSHSENPEFSSVVFLKVDVDEASDVSGKCEIKCMPTFQFYKNGKKIDEFSGADEEQLLQKLREHK
ncbi:hypothetical protein COCON_G00114600 [Conger conger]|uniref:Thioredoxin domain-containing protein n=1 Tax=Conger conger TaxID=82655 RepID=A0A9Q1HWC4_CONCO|nr:hypothetical protein COCON_G00114600 [Conger conger]